MMTGARDVLQRWLKRQVRILRVEAPQLSTPNYYTALGLLDYVFDHDIFGEGRAAKRRCYHGCPIRCMTDSQCEKGGTYATGD